MLRAWFENHADGAYELVLCYYTAGSNTWPESVDEAPCVGWIDGIRKRFDAERNQTHAPPCSRSFNTYAM